MDASTYLLLDQLWTAESKLIADSVSKSSFLGHQRRDLPSCWPGERDALVSEIAELELELSHINQALDILQSIIAGLQVLTKD